MLRGPCPIDGRVIIVPITIIGNKQREVKKSTEAVGFEPTGHQGTTTTRVSIGSHRPLGHASASMSLAPFVTS